MKRTAQRFLEEEGGQKFAIADIELDEGSTSEKYAKAAYSQCRASLKKLMPQRYRIVVRMDNGREDRFALTKYVKLVDFEAKEKRAKRVMAAGSLI